MPVPVSKAVKVVINDRTISAEGPKGKLQLDLPELTEAKLEDDQVIVTRASDEKRARAMHGLARSLINNMVIGVEKGFVKKLEIHGVGFKAAVQGSAAAQVGLGAMYAAGRGVAEDVEQATAWYRQAALQGEAEAEGWIRRTAEQGHADAQLTLGEMYAAGRGVAQDESAAAWWYRQAAEQGLPEAQYTLGRMYAEGLGVAQDDVEAVTWYREAADRGVATAQLALGGMYFAGQGVAEDAAEGVRWWRLAAEQGDAEVLRWLHQWEAAHPREP